MEIIEIFIAIVILLAGAKLLGELFRRLKQPTLGGGNSCGNNIRSYITWNNSDI